MDTSQQAIVSPKDGEGSAAVQRQRRSIAEKRGIVEETLAPAYGQNIHPGPHVHAARRS